MTTLIATPENTLTSKQIQAVAYLIKGHSWHETAQLAGCSVASIKRWNKEPDFREAIVEGQREALAAAAGQLAAGCTLAVSVLREIVGDEDVSPSTRVRASEVILSSAARAYELGELQRKVETLEASINGV